MAKWIRFEQDGKTGFGTLEGDTVVVHTGDMFAGATPSGEKLKLSGVRILTPSEPSKMICLWNNFHQLAAKNDFPVPDEPLYFLKAPSAYHPHDAPIVRPKSYDGRIIYEGELGIVIGAGGRYIPAGKALDAIAGFVVLNDASARDWQRAASQWTGGKNFEGSMPIGPEVVTTDEADVSDVALTTVLNGQVMQSARTSQMIVDVPSAVEFFSSFTRLAPGDVIATGTPGGVGFARQPPVWLHPGDVIEVTVENVGTIRNRVVAEPGDHAGWRWRPTGPQPSGL